MATPGNDAQAFIRSCLQETARVHTQLAGQPLEIIVKASEAMAKALRAGHKIIWFGNGGSATQSQHMAAEFVGRFGKDRRSLASISLTENMASVTAIANDYSYELLFARQLEGLGQAGDVAIGLSTSGSSKNVLAALQKAKELRIITIGLTGASAEKMRALCDLTISVPSSETARIQEAHLTIGHALCALVEAAVAPPAP